MIVLSVPVVGTSGANAIVKLSLHHDCISIGTISTVDCSNQTRTTGHLLMNSISLYSCSPTTHKVLNSVLQQYSIGTQDEAALGAEELDPVEVARDVLRVSIELEGLTAIGGLEDNSRPTHRPHVVVVPPAHIDDAVATGIDLRGLEQSLDVDLRQIGVRGRFLEAATNNQS